MADTQMTQARGAAATAYIPRTRRMLSSLAASGLQVRAHPIVRLRLRTSLSLPRRFALMAFPQLEQTSRLPSAKAQIRKLGAANFPVPVDRDSKDCVSCMAVVEFDS